MKLKDIYKTKEAVRKQKVILNRKLELLKYDLRLIDGELDYLDTLENEIFEEMKMEANYDAETSTLIESILVNTTEEV